MTDQWSVDPAAARSAVDWGRNSGRLFVSEEWSRVLQTLGCKTHFAWNDGAGHGLLIPVFRRWPVRIAFAGFPVSPSFLDQVDGACSEACSQLAQQLDLDVIRSNIQVRKGAERQSEMLLEDAWIDDLNTWSESGSKRLAKDLAFARRATGTLKFHDGRCDARAFHDLYLDVVRSHGGTARYTAPYFEQLMTIEGDRLRVVHAKDGSGRLVGASVLAMDGDTGYYLHSAVQHHARKLGLSDMLLHHLLAVARDQGMRRFCLMASPRDQPGLARFKAKWSERQGIVVTKDHGFGWLGRFAVRVTTFVASRPGRP